MTVHRTIAIFMAGGALLCHTESGLGAKPQPPKSTPGKRPAESTWNGLTESAAAPRIDPSRAYTLPELIDLAQRHNRTTRVAWGNARQAAIGYGLSEADFFPMLAVLASYGGGYWNLDLQFNNNIAGLEKQAGVIGAVLAGAVPSQLNLDQNAAGAYTAVTAGAALRWMLFDFGARAALRDSARQTQLAAGLAFDASHQAVAFRVTETYYTLEAARRLTSAATTSAESAKEILDATEGRFARGLVTEPVVMQIRQAKAQADFELINVRSQVEVARIDLAEAVGLTPDIPLRVAEADFDSLGRTLPKSLDQYVKAALRKRPDLLAKVAAARAAEARIRAAKADRLPKLSLVGVADYSQFQTSVQGAEPLDSFGLGLQNYGGFLTVQWPVFTGFADQNKIRAAESNAESAKEEALLARDRAIAEVWRAYTRARAAVARRAAAAALVAASRDAYDSLRAGLENGVTPLQDVVTARAALAQASAASAESDLAVAASLAALAFGAGNL